MTVAETEGPYDDEAGLRRRAAHSDFLKYVIDRPNDRGQRPIHVAVERLRRLTAVRTLFVSYLVNLLIAELVTTLPGTSFLAFLFCCWFRRLFDSVSSVVFCFVF